MFSNLFHQIDKIFLGKVVPANQHPIHTFKALNLFSRIFRALNSRAPMILEWDISTQSITLHCISNPSLRIWYFNVFLIAGIVGFGSSLDVIFHRKDLSISYVLICFIYATLSFLIWGSVLIVLLNYAGELEQGFSELRKLTFRLGNS